MVYANYPLQLFTPPYRTASRASWPNDSERHALDAFRNYFHRPGHKLPVKEGSTEMEPLSEREMMYLSQETLLAFLRAHRGHISEAIRQAERCIVWRRTTRIDDIDAMAKECEEELRTGMYYVQGFTTEGRPIVYIFPARNAVDGDKRRALPLLFMYERAKDLTADGVTDILAIFSFNQGKGISKSNKVTKNVVRILDEYYPEFVNLFVLEGLSWTMKAWLKIMQPMFDPNAWRRLKYRVASGPQIVAEGMVKSDVLLRDCGGTFDMPYDHDSYWPALLAVCKRNRAVSLQQWRDLGDPIVGRPERLFKAGYAW